jgi:hypothetical protein
MSPRSSATQTLHHPDRQPLILSLTSSLILLILYHVICVTKRENLRKITTHNEFACTPSCLVAVFLSGSLRTPEDQALVFFFLHIFRNWQMRFFHRSVVVRIRRLSFFCLVFRFASMVTALWTSQLLFEPPNTFTSYSQPLGVWQGSV